MLTILLRALHLSENVVKIGSFCIKLRVSSGSEAAAGPTGGEAVLWQPGRTAYGPDAGINGQCLNPYGVYALTNLSSPLLRRI